jgi:hypothetical protein
MFWTFSEILDFLYITLLQIGHLSFNFSFQLFKHGEQKICSQYNSIGEDIIPWHILHNIFGFSFNIFLSNN